MHICTKNDKVFVFFALYIFLGALQRNHIAKLLFWLKLRHVGKLTHAGESAFKTSK